MPISHAPGGPGRANHPAPPNACRSGRVAEPSIAARRAPQPQALAAPAARRTVRSCPAFAFLQTNHPDRANHTSADSSMSKMQQVERFTGSEEPCEARRLEGWMHGKCALPSFETPPVADAPRRRSLILRTAAKGRLSALQD